MGRLDRHLDHILNDVVPTRGAAQDGLDETYLQEIQGRAQPPHLFRGLEQWNAGRFYEQHETLEWLWRSTPDPVRDAIKGIIQSGIGNYHVMKRNRRGALAKWTGAIGYLEPFIGRRPYGIEIDHLREQVVVARQALLDDDLPDWETHRARVKAMEVRWESRPAEPRVTELLRRVDRAWQDGPTSVETAVDELTESAAEWVPAGGRHSIRTLLARLAVDKITTTSRCFGEAADLETVPPADWRKFRRWLVEAYEALREPLGFLRDDQLDQMCTMPQGEASLQAIIESTIERDLYCAGQINLLRELFAATGRER